MASGVKQIVYRALLNRIALVAGTRRAKEFDARFRYGRTLNLDQPHTLADKICWIELNTDHAITARCSDKWEVRDFVRNKGLEDILIPVCGGPWTHVDAIDVTDLPDAFVLKATHGCEMNYICTSKDELNVDDMLAKASAWLDSDYPRACVEPHYKLIPHRLYAEQFIGDPTDVVDYKFHCFNGEPSFVLVCSDRIDKLKLNLYDLEWNELEGLQNTRTNVKGISKPLLLEEMIRCSRTLAEDFDFVRVDLYGNDERVYFGELTFTPASGVLPYFTDGFIKCQGRKLRITDKTMKHLTRRTHE